MEELIVSSGVFTGYSTIFRIDGDTIDLAFKEEDWPTCNEIDMTRVRTLPFDLKYAIIEHMIVYLLKAGCVRKAMIVTLNSGIEVCKVFYCRHIGDFGLNRTQIFRHTMCLFKFIDYISEEIFGNTGYTDLNISLNFCTTNLDVCKSKMWPIDDIEIIEEPMPGVLEAKQNTGDHLYKIRTGPTYADVVWLCCKQEQGIVHASYIRGPIVIFSTECRNSQALSTSIITRRTKFFSNLVKMLKLCLGPRSGVYLTLPVEGFFNLLEEVV